MIDKIICGNTLDVLKDMEAESVDCVVTSPPYYLTRDYDVSNQLGLESTPEEYLIRLLTIFDEIRCVLKKEGNCFVVINTTFKNKMDLMIPERFAISMVERGWIKRRTVIWYKPSCMPSSVKDDFTLDFEYVYRFVRGNKYYFEQQFEALSEYILSMRQRTGENKGKLDDGGYAITTPQVKKYFDRVRNGEVNGRNRRCVWKINSACYKDAHFAVFPEKLVEPMILAGCPPDGLVLDPFVGSGTTCLVARKLGRHYIGIDLNEDYCTMARKRLNEVL